MSRAALGNVASLGELYDARKDTFSGISIFKKTPPEAALTHPDNHFSDIQLLHSDTFGEKFSKLDVSAELQVSVLAGLFSLSGSGRYLKDQKNSSRAVKSSLIYNIRTKDDNVNIFHEDLKDSFALDAIQSGVATHVVVGITWGANSVLSCEYQNTENRDIKEIEGSLSARLKIIGLSISGSGSVEFNEGANDKSINFAIKIYGDVLPRGQDLPTTFEAALELMKQMPNLVATCNDGRGMPLSYKLIPLTLLKDYLKFEMKADLVVKSLQEYSLVRIVQLFEKLDQARQLLNDFEKDATQSRFAVSAENIAKVISLVEGFSIEEAKFRSELGNMLASVRSGHAKGTDLEDFLARFEASPCSPTSVDATLLGMNDIVQKISFARTIIASGIAYIGFGTNLDDEIVKNFDTTTYLLYFNEPCKKEDPTSWQKNRQVFLQESKKSSEIKFIAVDCDIHESLWPGKVTIEVVESGQVIVKDLVHEQEQSSATAVAKCTVDLDQLVHKPNKRVNLVIPCTGRNCTPNVEQEWSCRKCGEVIEYGFDSFFYCGCGRGPASMFEFKCPDPKHGVNFERHSDKYLEELLAMLRPFKELNILILGETGVGKSTWINGFVNFMTFESLQEAEQYDLCTLIPSEFTVCDEDFNEITVTTGTDTNEVQNAGMSATQECKVYPFTVGDRLVRLIDTPGIGDTRGVDQDKKNFQNILSTLSYLQELHGICILLKPNNARLTVMFRFCIKELLTYLHRDASRNIMFCFTNARGTFYRPGDTLPALRNLLKENEDVVIPIAQHTIYCFDSEAYRFLAAIKNKSKPVKFADDECENFAKSWEKSISETKRMLKHISQLKPHPIQSTINLNHARELVVKLTRPLAEITKTIQTNKEVIKDHLELLKRTKENIADLQAQRFCDKQELEIIKLNYPKTVCTNVACTRVYGNGEFKQIEYRTECHAPCGLSGVAHDTVGDPGLLGCAAITNGYCNRSNCRHFYREHMHIYYDSKEVTKQVESESVKKSLNENISAAELKQNMIDEKNQLIKEQDDELKQIEVASVKFACFLKHNAITPYNDAMLEYMDHLIGEEKKKMSAGGTKKTLEQMQLGRASYENQIKILDKEMSIGDSTNILNPTEVEKLVKHLYKLKHNGACIKASLDAVESSAGQISQYREVVSAYKKKQKKKNVFKKGWDWLTGGN